MISLVLFTKICQWPKLGHEHDQQFQKLTPSRPCCILSLKNYTLEVGILLLQLRIAGICHPMFASCTHRYSLEFSPLGIGTSWPASSTFENFIVSVAMIKLILLQYNWTHFPVPITKLTSDFGKWVKLKTFQHPLLHMYLCIKNVGNCSKIHISFSFVGGKLKSFKVFFCYPNQTFPLLFKDDYFLVYHQYLVYTQYPFLYLQITCKEICFVSI